MLLIVLAIRKYLDFIKGENNIIFKAGTELIKSYL